MTSHQSQLRPLMGLYMACTMAMMAFVSLIGPLARELHLAAWQAGAVVTVGGLFWVALARTWGAASDRHGRRPVLLAGVGGFMLSYWAMCALLVGALHLRAAPWLAFIGLLVTRGAVGAFYAAIPAVGQAWVADQVPPAGRARALALLGAANAVGLVLGPALASVLTVAGLELPLYVTALLPALAFALLYRTKAQPAVDGGLAEAPALRLTDVRLRRPMMVAFLAMFCVSIAQITVGFFALDRLGLSATDAARAAGFALSLVGVGLMLAQVAVRRLPWTTHRLIRVGAAVGAVGFASVALARTGPALAAAFFVAAFGMGWVFPGFAALASNSVDAGEQGAAAGSIGAAQGLGAVLGPLAGTLLYEAGADLPYLLCGLVLLGVTCWPAARLPAHDVQRPRSGSSR